jgi:hypothetical protein
MLQSPREVEVVAILTVRSLREGRRGQGRCRKDVGAGCNLNEGEGEGGAETSKKNLTPGQRSQLGHFLSDTFAVVTGKVAASIPI